MSTSTTPRTIDLSSGRWGTREYRLPGGILLIADSNRRWPGARRLTDEQEDLLDDLDGRYAEDAVTSERVRAAFGL